MSETERRRKYVAPRALIEASRVLATTFDDADFYFTGAQIEIMRNLMQYANRAETYVSEYESGYYLIPDDTDWDNIQSIVADLEETLMGNPNTLWGYTDRYLEYLADESDVAGGFVVNLGSVPEGELWRVMGVAVWRSTNAGRYARLRVISTVDEVTVDDIPMPNTGAYYPSVSEFVMKYTDNIRVTFAGATIGEDVIVSAWGYKMVVS